MKDYDYYVQYTKCPENALPDMQDFYEALSAAKLSYEHAKALEEATTRLIAETERVAFLAGLRAGRDKKTVQTVHEKLIKSIK